MKKRTALLLTLLLIMVVVLSAVGLTACKPKDEKTGFHVSVFYYDYKDTYISTVRNEIDARLKGLGVNYQSYDGKNDQATQIADIDTALSQGTNLLIVNIVKTDSVDSARNIVNKAQAKNVPVVFFNREPPPAIFTTDWAITNTAFVGTNFVQAGYMQGQMIAEYLLKPENLTQDGKSKFDVDSNNEVKYIMLRGEMSNNEAIARTLYSVLTANIMLKQADASFTLKPSDGNVESGDVDPPLGWEYNYGGVKKDLATVMSENTFKPLKFYLVDPEGSWSSAAATNLLDTAFAKPGMLSGGCELIIANNDGMALGAISSLQKKNYNKGGTSPIIPVFGVDATSEARQAINDGKLMGSISQSNVSMAQMIVQVMTNAAAKKPLADFGTLNVEIDGLGKNMIRIPYGIVT